MLPSYEQVQDKEPSFVHSGERLQEGQYHLSYMAGAKEPATVGLG